jgi:hypothetical protein
MPFNVKKRGKLTFYFEGDRPALSSLVTEALPDGDLKISFAGLTGGYSAKSVLGLDALVVMDPEREIPLVFACWQKWLRDAGICDSLRDVDFIEIHAFGCQPKTPHPLVDPTGFAVEKERLRRAYAGRPSARQWRPRALHRPRRRCARHRGVVRVLRHRAAATDATCRGLEHPCHAGAEMLQHDTALFQRRSGGLLPCPSSLRRLHRTGSR